jgi:hypothetical protein
MVHRSQNSIDSRFHEQGGRAALRLARFPRDGHTSSDLPLRRPTSGTRAPVNAAIMALRAIYRPGYAQLDDERAALEARVQAGTALTAVHHALDEVMLARA